MVVGSWDVVVIVWVVVVSRCLEGEGVELGWLKKVGGE